jgi:hypothetical protein
MVTLIEAIGYLAIAFGAHTILPVADAVDKYNDRFAMRVDAGKSCWDRVSGKVGVYGGPHEFTMDAMCNYKLHKETVNKDVTVWKLKRN